MSDYCIDGNKCFAVARGVALMLFDQIRKHYWNTVGQPLVSTARRGRPLGRG